MQDIERKATGWGPRLNEPQEKLLEANCQTGLAREQALSPSDSRTSLLEKFPDQEAAAAATQPHKIRDKPKN